MNTTMKGKIGVILLMIAVTPVFAAGYDRPVNEAKKQIAEFTALLNN
ncbi:MAG: hypothetical protein LBO80_06835 [Treponema sp.]|jgi:hypothetical protein|nr:hypothetical protein [Treponema sp.]